MWTRKNVRRNYGNRTVKSTYTRYTTSTVVSTRLPRLPFSTLLASTTTHCDPEHSRHTVGAGGQCSCESGGDMGATETQLLGDN